MVWTLVLHGWRHWNRTAQVSGNSLGTRIRRWWYRTNNWPLNESVRQLGSDKKLARDMSEVSFRLSLALLCFADKFVQYYQNQNSGD